MNTHAALSIPAPRGPPALAALSGIPAAISVSYCDHDHVRVAQALVRARHADHRDWSPGNPSPQGLIKHAATRAIDRFNRHAPEILPVVAFVRPFAEFLAELYDDPPDDERRWVLGIHSEETHRLFVGPLVEVLGEHAAAVVLGRLVRDTPVCIGTPDDLEWIVDGWLTSTREETEEAREILRRAEEAAEHAQRILNLLRIGRRAALDVLPPGRVRRLLGAMQAFRARASTADDTAWRETEGVDWTLPRPVIHLVWEPDTALEHAIDEAEHLEDQGGCEPAPQQMWLLDPDNAAEAARTWARWTLSLRGIATASRLVEALEILVRERPTRR